MALSAQENGAIPAPNVYVNCQYRVAAIFPSAPSIRDIAYTNGGRTVPARQFYVQRGADLFSVTVADFTDVAADIEEVLGIDALVVLAGVDGERRPAALGEAARQLAGEADVVVVGGGNARVFAADAALPDGVRSLGYVDDASLLVLSINYYWQNVTNWSYPFRQK